MRVNELGRARARSSGCPLACDGAWNKINLSNTNRGNNTTRTHFGRTATERSTDKSPLINSSIQFVLFNKFIFPWQIERIPFYLVAFDWSEQYQI